MRLTLLAAAAAMLHLPAPALAAMPDLTAFRHASAVADAELGGLRGRFLSAGQITFFGIQLYTAWRAGDMITAVGLNFNVVDALGTVQSQNSGGVGATASFFQFDPNSADPSTQIPAGDLPPSAVVVLQGGAGGLESGPGVAQSVQIAGDDNGAFNDLRLNIGGVGEPLVPLGPTGDPVALTGTKTVTFPNGTTATAIFEGNQLGVVMGLDGAGIARQGILSGAESSLAQHIALSSDLNRLSQQMVINIQLDPGLRNSRIGAATLSGLQGLAR